MIELIDCMMQHFLPGVTFNMLFGHIWTLKLIMSGILSKFNLSTRGLNSLTYPVYLKINLLSLLFLLIFKNKESLITCYKYNKPIRSTVLTITNLETKLDIENFVSFSWGCKGSLCCCQPAGRVVPGDLGIMAGSRVQSIICRGPKYRFPLPVGFRSCRGEIAVALREFCSRWCGQGHVESGALGGWKLGVFKTIGGGVSFYRNDLGLLPPRP